MLDSMLTVGIPAPSLDLETQFGNRWRLVDRRGRKNVMIVFYPADWTPICTSELPELNRMLPSFTAADTEVVACSVDSKPSHVRWSETLGGISFPMLCDCWPKGECSRRFGVLLEDRGVSDRATVIVGKDGIVRYAQSVGLDGRRDFSELLGKAQEINGQPRTVPTSSLASEQAPASCATVSYDRPRRIKAAEAVLTPADATLYLSRGCIHCEVVRNAMAGMTGHARVVVKEVSDPEAREELLSLSPGGQVPTIVLKGGKVLSGRDQVLAELKMLLPVRS